MAEDKVSMNEFRLSEVQKGKDSTLQIAICDDEKTMRKYLELMLKNIFKAYDMNIRISLFQSGHELLEQVHKFQLIFLDIMMYGMDGIETGKEVRKRNQDCKIIMITGAMERVFEVFEFNAYRFLVKPVSVLELKEVIESYLSEANRETIKVYQSRKEYMVSLWDIKYVCSYGSNVEVVTENQNFRKETSLKNIEGELQNEMFFRVNRQVLINMHWIDSYTNGKIIIGNEKFEVARRRKKDFEEQYVNFNLKKR